jgi:hypothetical protein
MSGTLTVNLDSEIMHLSEQEAQARHTTLPEVVARQLGVMAGSWLAIGGEPGGPDAGHRCAARRGEASARFRRTGSTD